MTFYLFMLLVTGNGSLHASAANFRLELKKPSHLESRGDSTRARELGEGAEGL